MTRRWYEALIKDGKPKGNKYKNKSTKVGDRTFPSICEAEVYKMLLLRQNAGNILNLKCQAQLYISEAQIGYRADFEWVNGDGYIEYGEAKGAETDTWLLKKKLWSVYGWTTLYVWAYDYRYQHVILKEEIKPKYFAPEYLTAPSRS